MKVKDMKFLNEEDIWALSITVTGKCNCNCSYCHFYAARDRQAYNIDMSEELFDNYVELINIIKNKYHKKLQVRFSGGEPLMIGDKLFEYSNKLFEKTGLSSYVLTNGRLLSEDVIEKARRAHIEAFLVSIENPFEQSEGAPATDEVLEKIKTYDSDTVHVLPAIMVVKNGAFNKLFDIADYIYEKIGILPSFSELTYHAFESPTKEEISELYKNVRMIAKKYYGKAAIRIFPYVSPELYANNQKNYLTELDLENSIKISKDNVENVAESLFKKLHNSYVKNPCENEECEWYQDCRIIKWLWMYTYDNPDITVERKLQDFCNMKKALNNGLLDGILENRKNREK